MGSEFENVDENQKINAIEDDKRIIIVDDDDEVVQIVTVTNANAIKVVNVRELDEHATDDPQPEEEVDNQDPPALEIIKGDSMRKSTANIEDMAQRELNLSADLNKKIMDAIKSESEKISALKVEMPSCNSLTIKPVEKDLEKKMQQLTGIREELKQANK